MRVSKLFAGSASAALLLTCPPVLANNFGENAGWQFQSSADKANAAVVQDMIRKQKSGYYAAPTYTTNIARQYNCSLSASAAGNSGSNSTVANSPSTAGASSSATGNGSSTTVDGYGSGSAQATPGVTGSQSNSGHVGSNVVGSTRTSVSGDARQVLNSEQGNSGAQSASIGSSNACAFGALN